MNATRNDDVETLEDNDAMNTALKQWTKARTITASSKRALANEETMDDDALIEIYGTLAVNEEQELGQRRQKWSQWAGHRGGHDRAHLDDRPSASALTTTSFSSTIPCVLCTFSFWINFRWVK